MPDINLLDETFDKNQSVHYHLSIQIDKIGITYSLLDTIRNKFNGLRHFAIPDGKSWKDISIIKEILLSDEILKLPFNSTSCMVVEGRNTLVPQELFDPSTQQELFRFNHHIDEQEVVIHNKLSHAQSTNVFAIPLSVQQLFLELFPTATIYHRVTPFIENLVYESGKAAESVVLYQFMPTHWILGLLI